MGDFYEQPDRTWRYDPAAPSPGHDPAVTMILPARSAAPADPNIGRPGANDHLIERTDNSLRPDDLALDQPPQDPTWEPT